MEWNGHNSISCVKCFFDTVPVMNVNIDVQDTLMIFQQFQDGQDNVVDVTETWSFGFFGVMESSSPIDGNVCSLFVQLYSRSYWTSGRQLTKFVEAVEDGAIFTDVEPLHLFVVLAHVVWTNGTKKSDIVIRMKFGHFFLGCFVRSVDLHFPIKAIVQQKVVGHAYPVRFHGMALSIIIVSNVTFKK